MSAALRLLAQRPHATAELDAKLRRRGFPEAAVAAVLQRLAELGLLDDLAFARALVEQRSASRGPVAIAAELSRRGVAREVAEAALAELDPDRQLATARLLASGLRPDRAAARLRQRGFDEEQVERVLRDGGPAE
jgi:regulatory protein